MDYKYDQFPNDPGVREAQQMVISQANRGGLGVILAADAAQSGLVDAAAAAGGSAVLAGPGVIAHFSSAVAALECAVDWRRSQATPPAMAISLGMVEADGQSGEAVDHAKGLLAAAQAGDLWITEQIHGLVADAVPLVFVVADDALRADFDADPNQPPPRSRLIPVMAAAALVLIIGGGLWFVLGGEPVIEVVEVANRENMALPLPDLPSVAVVEFAVAEGQALPDHASQGMAAELARRLGANPELFVMNPGAAPGLTSANTAAEIAEALGVRFVFLGTNHPDQTPMELHGRLVDALTGQVVWQGTHALEPAGVTALANDLVAVLLPPEITPADADQPNPEPADAPVAAPAVAEQAPRPVNDEAFALYLRGRDLMTLATPSANAQAGALFREALELDPAFADATIELGFTQYYAAQGFDGDLTGDILLDIEALVRPALEQATNNPRGMALQSRLQMLRATMFRGGVESISPRYLAVDLAQRAVAAAPSDADNLAYLSRLYSFGIRTSQEALEMIERAMRINPNYPWTYQHVLGQNYQLTGRYEEAIVVLLAALERAPDTAVLHRELALTYVLADDVDSARLHLAELLRLVPNYTVATESQESIYMNPLNLERDVITLRRAGLPFAYREP
jgi:adenylate cyclase